MQLSQPLRLPSHFTKPAFAMTLRQQVLLLHQAPFALERRIASPRMRCLHTQQLTQILITVCIYAIYISTPHLCIPAKRGSEGALHATLATYFLESGWQDTRKPAARTPLAGDCENSRRTFTALYTCRSTVVS